MSGVRAVVGKIHQLFLCNRNDSSWDEKSCIHLCSIIGENFESFTIQEGVGYFRSVSAPTIIVTLGTDDTELVCLVGQKLRQEFSQEGVGLACDGIYQRLIA